MIEMSYHIYCFALMLANLIISSTPLMTSQKDPTSIKSTHFAPQLEVFNYTGSKSTNSDDSLLITPNQKEAERQRLIETATFNKPILEEKTKEQQDCQYFEEQAKRKRRDFLRRMTHNTAISQAQPQQSLPVYSQQPKRIIKCDVSMEIEEGKNATISTLQLEHANHQIQVIEEQNPLINEVQKPISQRKPISYLSKENQEKIQSFSKLMMSANEKLSDAKEVVSKEKIQKMKLERRRVTQDLKTLLNLYVFNQSQQTLEGRQGEPHQLGSNEGRSQEVGSSNNQKQSQVRISGGKNIESHRRESLIERAISRLSGGKTSRVAKRDRVTLETSEIYGILKGSQNEKEAWMSKIETIREQVDRIENQPSRELGQKCRQDLKRYLEQTNFRVKGIDEKNNSINHQTLAAQQALRHQQGFLKYLDQQIAKKTVEKAEIIDKTANTKKMIEPQQAIKNLMTPLYYLEDHYNVRITTYEVKKGSSSPGAYVLDFIIDRDIYCRIKRSQSHLPTIFIRTSTAAEVSPPEWTVDIKLRIQALSKYFKLKLQHFQPIEILLHLGRYYEQLQQLENDFQMIEKIYELNELTLSPGNDRLTFKLDIHYQMTINVIVNLLNFRSKQFYQLEVIPIQPVNSEEEHLRPLCLQDNGQRSLISFITTGLEQIMV